MTNYKLKAESVKYKYTVGRASFTYTLEYIKRRPLLLALLFILTFGPPFLGFVLVGASGVIVGLVIAIICWFLSTLAVQKVIEHQTTL